MNRKHNNDGVSLNPVAERYLSSLGYSSIQPLGGGHTKAILYQAVDSSDALRVIKIGSVSGDNSEIDANRFGFDSLIRERASSLIPNPIEYGEIAGRRFVIMPYLGVDLAKKDRQGEVNHLDYEFFAGQLVQLVKDSITVDSDGETSHLDGVYAMKRQLKSWFDRLVDAMVITEEEVNNLLDFDIRQIASNRASIMIMDFTPDNIFIDENKVSFIDPWRQETYRGTFVPSLSQFVTLAVEVYGLPSATEARPELDSAIDSIGKLLGLTTIQIHAQYMLGQGLQYTLSSFVRLNTDPTFTREYIDRAKKSIQALKSDIILIKGEKR